MSGGIWSLRTTFFEVVHADGEPFHTPFPKYDLSLHAWAVQRRTAFFVTILWDPVINLVDTLSYMGISTINFRLKSVQRILFRDFSAMWRGFCKGSPSALMLAQPGNLCRDLSSGIFLLLTFVVTVCLLEHDWLMESVLRRNKWGSCILSCKIRYATFRFFRRIDWWNLYLEETCEVVASLVVKVVIQHFDFFGRYRVGNICRRHAPSALFWRNIRAPVKPKCHDMATLACHCYISTYVYVHKPLVLRLQRYDM